MPSDSIAFRTNLQAALNAAKEGFAVIPFRLVPNPTPGKGPIKRPCISDWPNRATTNEKRIRDWWAKRPDAIPGIVTGGRNGILVIDPDVKNGKDGLSAMRAIGLDPDTLSPIIVQTPTTGRHLYFAWQESIGNSGEGLPYGVDIRGEGGYVAAPGAVTPKGEYRFIQGSLALLADCREFHILPPLPDALTPRRTAKDKGESEPTGLPFHVIRAALMALPNDADSYAHRDAWLMILMALHAESVGSDEGRAAAHDWSGKWPGYDKDATDTAWDSFHVGKGVTGWTIIRDAESRGWSDPALTELRRIEAMEEAQDDFTDQDVEQPVDEEEAVRVAKNKRALLTPDECLAGLTDSPDYLIKGLIERGSLSAFYGKPNAGKTNLALYAAYRVAQGQPAFGRRVKQTPVLYVAYEGPRGMKRRVGTLRREYGPADGFHLMLSPPNLKPDRKEKGLGMTEIIRCAKEVGAGLVVVDTLATAFAGIEENAVSADGMSVAIRELQRLAAEADCAVIVLHHPAKGQEEMRGSGALLGAVDMTLHVEKDEESGIVTGCTKKARDTAGGDVFAYRNHGVHLADDEDGDSITSVILREVHGERVAKGEKLPASVSAAYQIFRQLSDGGKSVSEDKWRDACVDGRAVSGSDNHESRGKAYKRATEVLARRGLVAFKDGLYFAGVTHTGIRSDGSEDFDGEGNTE